MARAIASDFKRGATLTRTGHGCAKPPRHTRRSTSALLLQPQPDENRLLALKKTDPTHPATVNGRCWKFSHRKHRARRMSMREVSTQQTRKWLSKMRATFTPGAAAL